MFKKSKHFLLKCYISLPQVCDLHDGFWICWSHPVLALPSHLPPGLHRPLADALVHLPLLHGARGRSPAVYLWNHLTPHPTPSWLLLLWSRSNCTFFLSLFFSPFFCQNYSSCLKLVAMVVWPGADLCKVWGWSHVKNSCYSGLYRFDTQLCVWRKCAYLEEDNVPNYVWWPNVVQVIKNCKIPGFFLFLESVQFGSPSMA